ncbi:MAG: hypothetical protein QOE97_1031 [Pseudonocardiales bacterium]|jgi:hypothetical protein|nr:hypothetical protein [Pseudonocardiales bacterium]
MTEQDTTTGGGAPGRPQQGEARRAGREDDGQDYIDRSSIDFDPDEGLLSGTAIEGTSNIPGPHERGEDADPDDTEDGLPDEQG